MKRKLGELKQGEEKSAIPVGDFNIPLSGTDRGCGKEERKGGGKGGAEGLEGKEQRERDGERENPPKVMSHQGSVSWNHTGYRCAQNHQTLQNRTGSNERPATPDRRWWGPEAPRALAAAGGLGKCSNTFTEPCDGGLWRPPYSCPATLPQSGRPTPYPGSTRTHTHTCTHTRTHTNSAKVFKADLFWVAPNREQLVRLTEECITESKGSYSRIHLIKQKHKDVPKIKAPQYRTHEAIGRDRRTAAWEQQETPAPALNHAQVTQTEHPWGNAGRELHGNQETHRTFQQQNTCSSQAHMRQSLEQIPGWANGTSSKEFKKTEVKSSIFLTTMSQTQIKWHIPGQRRQQDGNKKNLETNKNRNMIYQNLHNAAKAVSKGSS